MPTNTQRRTWARKAIKAYQEAKKVVEPIDDGVITDLVTDLLHVTQLLYLTRKTNVEPRSLVERAMNHFEVESGKVNV